MTRTAAMLCLFAALRDARAGRTELLPSNWSDADWVRFVAHLEPRKVVVLALHGIRGWGHERISDWFGEDGRGMGRGNVHRLWKELLSELPVAGEPRQSA